MKYVVFLCDGMADLKLSEFGDKTPLEAAHTPNMDNYCKKAILGTLKTVPDRLSPGSDVCNLSVMGYDSDLYYSGRSPLEAASIGVNLADHETSFRANLVTLSGEGAYEELVMEDYMICVPEEWDKTLRQMDGRGVLRDILTQDVVYSPTKKKLRPENLHIVTEPEAASAYFAHLYRKNTGTAFNGYLLLIDYGGGTLDITLSNITPQENDDLRMEIKAVEHGGVGENHGNPDGTFQIGNAGIAYMQQVVKYALKDSGFDFTLPDPEFVRAVRQLESMLMEPLDDEGCNKIEMTFFPYGDYSDFGGILTDSVYDDSEIGRFGDLIYNGDEIPVTYRQLYRAYHDIIEPVLKNELEKITEKVKMHIGRNPCTPQQGLQEDFKIALVGGFANFYLVQKQIHEFYSIDMEAEDGRLRNIDAAEMEKAIACGAALIAEERVHLHKLAPLSVGLYATGFDEKPTIHYGIRYHQPIEFGKPCFMLRDNAPVDTVDNRVTYFGTAGITHLILQDDERLNCGQTVRLKEALLDRIRALPTGFYRLGFSMDANGIYTLHALGKDADPNSEGVKIPLDNIERMADLQTSETVVC